MKVYYKTTIKPAYKSTWRDSPEHEEHRELDTIFCCNSAKTAWYDGYIGFHDGNNWVPEIHIEKQAYGDPDYLGIQYCPFCATKIEFIEKERVKEIRKEKTETKEVTTEYTEEVPI